MIKLINVLTEDKINVCLKLESSEVKRIYRGAELLPDFDFIPYDGMVDRNYPVWQEFNLSGEAIFIHRLVLEDYGYFVDNGSHDDLGIELPKETSDSTGRLALKLQMLDHFGCRVLVSGSLSGSSAEMNMDVRFKFIMASYSVESSLIGYPAEAIAEGFAFEEEKKLKQAFFSYFSAIDSFVEAEREKLNTGRPGEKQIKPDIRLAQKLQAIVKAHMPPSVGGLNKIKIWGDVMNGFGICEEIRNAIAHNRKAEPVDKADVDLCFAVFAIIVAMVKDGLYDEKAIKEHYCIERN